MDIILSKSCKYLQHSIKKNDYKLPACQANNKLKKITRLLKNKTLYDAENKENLSNNHHSVHSIELVDSLEPLSLKNDESQIQQLAKNLKKLLLILNDHEKKNRVLKNLIDIIKKKQQQTMIAMNDPQESSQIRKLENWINSYEISCNELTAKNKSLKEQILISRRNRAMYSVLFRDLQKEIKIYGDQYRECLLKSEAAYENFYHNQSVKDKEDSMNNLLRNSQMMESVGMQQGITFLTENHVNFDDAANEFYSAKKSNKLLLVKTRKQFTALKQNINQKQTAEYQIQSMLNTIQKMCLLAEMDVNKMEQSMCPNGIGLKNEQLSKKVGKLDQNINKYERRIEKYMKKIQRNQLIGQVQLHQNQKQFQSDQSQQNQQSKPNNQQKKQPPQQPTKKTQNLILYKNLAQLLNISSQNIQEQSINRFSQKIEQIFEKPPNKSNKILFHKIQINTQLPAIGKQSSKQQTVQNRPQSLDVILSNIKMMTCYQRAFERMQFEQQYHLEKNRKKKTKIWRKNP